ncbi:hypothetical protein LOD99_1962 [Oopsacas minuta]|uniref:Cadherin domain-containing protein n=1 Tax=Oopsacas minuta TaxID=111878 RepID=A0AAV7K3S5_9METZ|nr:hypothetical protein LOD99_1962 [Oopsacas minuta]
MYSITVRATDFGLMPLSSTADIMVYITPTNTYPPVFTSPDNYTVYIQENILYSDTILSVTAVDLDEGILGQVEYLILTDYTFLHINTNNGSITLLSALDNELYRDGIIFQVQANDLAAAEYRKYSLANESLPRPKRIHLISIFNLRFVLLSILQNLPPPMPTDKTRLPHIINQSEPNYLVRDLNLTKDQSELLGSRLKGWNLLDEETKVSFFRTRQSDFSVHFEMQGSLCYCNNVDRVMELLGVQHEPSEWRLFIDSSKYRLKAVLLHKGNVLPSIPIGHSVHMKESHGNMDILLKLIKYNSYNWHICGDLKVIGLLLGMQYATRMHKILLLPL